MKTFLVSLLIAFSLYGQNFDAFLSQIDSTQEELRQGVVDSFMQTLINFPYIETTSAYFIFRGNASTVNVAGDFNSWDLNRGKLLKISGTNFYYLKNIFENDARLDYKFVLNGSTWITDPLNPHTVTGGYGPNSELAMPGYTQPWEIKFNSEIEHGDLVYINSFHSDIRNNNRSIYIYLPSQYNEEPERRFPSIYVNDGGEYKNLGSIKNVLDNMIAADLIEPVIAILVNPVDRNTEYWMNDSYTEMLSNELIPFIDSTYRTINNAEKRMIMGASLGGVASAYACLKKPDYFSMCGSHSGAFWINDFQIIQMYETSSVTGLSFYLDWGTYYDTREEGIALQNILTEKGFHTEAKEWHEGHSWGSWRAHIDEILLTFFSYEETSIGDELSQKIPSYFNLRNYPNPFNPSTKIQFQLPTAGKTKIVIYQESGQIISTILNKYSSAGDQTVNFSLANQKNHSFASGVYYCTITQKQMSETIKILFLK